MIQTADRIRMCNNILQEGNNVIQILICDDELPILQKIQAICKNYFDGKQMKVRFYAYQDPSLLSRQILSLCDIALLDMDFEHKQHSGMTIARRIREVREDCIIIFVTNYIEFAPEGYKVHAFRYLLKKNLWELEYCLSEGLAYRKQTKDAFSFQLSGEIMCFPLEAITYFEVQQHEVTIWLQGENGTSKRHYTFRENLSDIEQQLEPHGFLRIHKSFLVNMRYIQKFQCREVTLRNGIILSGSEKAYRENKNKYLLWREAQT